MDKRILLFWLLATAIWFGWMSYENSRNPPRKLQRNADGKVAQVDSKTEKPAAKDATDTKDGAEKKPAADGKSDEKSSPKTDAKTTKDAAATPPGVKPAEIKPTEPPKPTIPLRTDMVLGDDSPGLDAKFDIFARFTNRGAGVYYLHLNKYENEHRKGPMVLLSEETPGDNSFLLFIKGDDPSQLAKRNWEVVESTNERIVFRADAMAGKLIVEKHYSLKPGQPIIDLQIVLKNASDQSLSNVEYVMSGGAGLPIEGRWYTNYYRKTVAIVVPEKGSAPFLEEQDVTEIVSNFDAKKPQKSYSGYPLRLGGRRRSVFRVADYPEGQSDRGPRHRESRSHPLSQGAGIALQQHRRADQFAGAGDQSGRRAET